MLSEAGPGSDRRGGRLAPAAASGPAAVGLDLFVQLQAHPRARLRIVRQQRCGHCGLSSSRHPDFRGEHGPVAESECPAWHLPAVVASDQRRAEAPGPRGVDAMSENDIQAKQRADGSHEAEMAFLIYRGKGGEACLYPEALSPTIASQMLRYEQERGEYVSGLLRVAVRVSPEDIEKALQQCEGGTVDGE